MTRVSDIFSAALLESLGRYELAARKLSASGFHGEQRSRRRGEGLEYADHRAYAWGDDLRRLDWHALARLDAMLVRLYAVEDALPLHVVVDASASMAFGEPSKFVTAARVGACLAQIALLRAAPVRWHMAGPGAPEPARLRGRNGLGRVLRLLDEWTPGGDAALGKAVRRAVQDGPRRSVMVVLTDGYDVEELRPALRACRSLGAEAYLLLIWSEQERQPSARGEHALQDSESGSQVPLVIDRGALKRYRNEAARFIGEWQEFCRGHGIGLLQLPAEQPIGPELFRELVQHGLLA
jgi:uncharacterized protein (DUF58 family)